MTFSGGYQVTCHDVFVVRRDVAAQHARLLLGLEDGGSVRRPPGVQKVVLAGGHKPFATVCILQGKDAALVQVQLVLLGLGRVQHLHVGVLHADGEPVPGGAVAEAEDLAAEVVLLQLSALPEVPGPDRVVQAPGPQLGAVSRDVDAAGPVRVALELPDQGLVVQVPDRDVAVTAAAEAHLGVGADGQRVAGRGRAGELRLDAGVGGRQVPDGQGAGLAPHHQGAAVGQQLDGADVVLPLQTVQLGDGRLVPGLGDVPHLAEAFTIDHKNIFHSTLNLIFRLTGIQVPCH